MELSKKPKRPRIGESQEINTENSHFEKVTYHPNATYAGDNNDANNIAESATRNDYRATYNQNNYQRNNYNRNSRPQGGFNRDGGYNNRQGGYNNYRQQNQGGYNNNRQQGGYNNYRQQNQGGYNNYRQQNNFGGQQDGYNRIQNQNYDNNRQQGGYNNYRQQNQGGYNNRQQGGFNNNRQQGSYNNYRQQNQGGYNNRQQGGFNNNRQGGYNSRQQGGFNNHRPQAGKRFTPRPQQIIYDAPIVDPNEEIRLNKFMANAGICSRREADELIQKGLVKVNGVAVSELGTKIKREDVVEYNDQVVTLENKCYILLNKPKDCVTTSDDPDGRLTVMDLVKNACKERIYPVGRLDRNTTGVLLLTNDGDLASKLTHPKFVKKKIYQVWTDKNISEEDMQRLADGIELEDGPIHADAISYVNDRDRNQAGIEIHSGRNRIVRRMFEHLGYRVTKLDRVYFAGLTKKNLPRGRWRYLSQEEVNFLKQGSFE